MRAASTISMGREASRYCFMKKNTVGAAMLEMCIRDRYGTYA